MVSPTLEKYPGVRPIPKRISFNYPNGVKRHGVVRERVFEESPGVNGDYLMVIEVIAWDGEPGSTVRFGYYRKEKHERKWRWGSQTTFHFSKRKTERIIRKAVAKGFLKL